MTENSRVKIGGIILAAGGSSRLGRPKQLVQFQGKSLIRRAAETLADSRCDPIVVVVGAEIDGSTSEIVGLPVSICINKDWQTGMSSSIKAGLKEILHMQPDLAAVVITLGDQPHVTSDDLDLLISEFHRTNAPIVAASYSGTSGVPALFSKDVFDSLDQLQGDKGARYLIRGGDDTLNVSLDRAAIDIDTQADVHGVS